MGAAKCRKAMDNKVILSWAAALGLVVAIITFFDDLHSDFVSKDELKIELLRHRLENVRQQENMNGKPNQ